MASIAVTIGVFELIGWGVNTVWGTVAFVCLVVAVGAVMERTLRSVRRR
ncbi:MAG: hypothetical protein QOG70_277 [Solirubrobacteraceae bacterium]|nr:hypothetical protein [Solirubrobacteraceae bacterium]